MSEDDSLPKCQCGRTRRTREGVIADCAYSFWGYAQLLLMGGSVIPKRVKFRCVFCGQTIEIIEDPETLKAEAGTLY